MDIAYFHAWLSERLRVRGVDLRERFSRRLPTAHELDNVILLETLANDVVNVSEHLFVLFQMLLLIDGVADSFESVSYSLFRRVGVDFVPHDASDLVRWLMMEALHGERRQRTSAGSGLGCLPSAQSMGPLASRFPERSWLVN